MLESFKQLCYNIANKIKTHKGKIMKLYAPVYYKKFRCIADKCEHSCCIGWEIDIDQNTLKKYKKLEGSYSAAIKDSISIEDAPHFKLCEGDRCPHLDERGLCKIIMNVGKDYLCDICREHPRFYNYTSVAEVGIGMSCTEAARIILSSQNYAELVEIGNINAEADDTCFDGRVPRSEIYAILQDSTHDYKSKLEKIHEKYSIDTGEDSRWLEALDSLEYLDIEHKKLFMNYSSKSRPEEKDEYLERFLAYFIYRHCTEAFDNDDFCDRLAFCLFCERLFASIICSERAETLSEIAVLARIISEEIEYSDENTSALIY